MMKTRIFLSQMNDKWTVKSLETSTVLFGTGCLFAWIGLLRYFNFNYKFHASIFPFSGFFFDLWFYVHDKQLCSCQHGQLL